MGVALITDIYGINGAILKITAAIESHGRAVSIVSPYESEDVQFPGEEEAYAAFLNRCGHDGFCRKVIDAVEKDQKIGDLHGQTIQVKTSYGAAFVVPLYHPAVALYNAGQKSQLMDDFKRHSLSVKQYCGFRPSPTLADVDQGAACRHTSSRTECDSQHSL